METTCKKCWYGNVGTRVWKPGMGTWECGNKSTGTNILEWKHGNHSIGVGITVWERGYWNMGMGMGEYGNVGTTVWERGYWNHTNLAKHILAVPPAHVLLHGLGVFFLGQFE